LKHAYRNWHAARDALEVLRKLLALNRTLPEVKVAIIGPAGARGG
jgi:aldehyde:ferredoxin oxidoreductase